jgi:DNA-binding IclR family transcriptional regulator
VGRPTRKDKPILPDYGEGIQIKTEDEDPRFNNALARGLAILRSFQLDQTLLGNVELAEATKLPKSTISRLTYTLTQLGYLHYREEFGKYELAAGVVGLGVHEGMSILYLEYALGEANPNRRQRVGFRVPLVRTAMGRACIGAMRADERDRLYAELSSYYRREWPALQQELDDAVAQVEAKGYCIAAGTFQRSTNSVAVPFVHADGRTLMALNSQGSATAQTQAVMERNGRKLVEMAGEIRKRLAAAPPTPSLGRR